MPRASTTNCSKDQYFGLKNTEKTMRMLQRKKMQTTVKLYPLKSAAWHHLSCLLDSVPWVINDITKTWALLLTAEPIQGLSSISLSQVFTETKRRQATGLASVWSSAASFLPWKKSLRSHHTVFVLIQNHCTFTAIKEGKTSIHLFVNSSS